MQNNLFGITLHYFHSNKPYQGSISREQFADIIERFEDRITQAGEWAYKAMNNKLKNELCLTFDDGLYSQFEVAFPVLRKYGLTAFWFINTNVLGGDFEHPFIYKYFRDNYFKNMDEYYKCFFEMDINLEDKKKKMPSNYLSQFTFYSLEDKQFRFIRDEILGSKKFKNILNKMMHMKQFKIENIPEKLWMDKSDIQKLERYGNIIGLHSHTHPTAMNKLLLKNQNHEYQLNYNILNGFLEHKPYSMSHPENSYSKETIEILKKLEIKIGFRADNIKRKYSILELPRADVKILMEGFL